jgi:dsDNA-binding SOS-regulon protein
MNPAVVAAIIAASISFLTLIGTLAAQFYGIRKTSSDTAKTRDQQEEQLDRTLAEQREQLDRTLAEQREQLDRTLAEQREQLDRTLAEQRTRTLTNGSPRRPGSWAAISRRRSGWLGCMPWPAWLTTGRRTGRPASTCCAPICACPTSPIRAKMLLSRSGLLSGPAAKFATPSSG